MRNIVSLQPSDIAIQIVPKTPNEQTQNIVYLPDKSEGFTIPTNLFFVDNVGKDLCGVFELKTVYYNIAIGDFYQAVWNGTKTPTAAQTEIAAAAAAWILANNVAE